MKRIFIIILSMVMATTLSAQEIEPVEEFINNLHLEKGPTIRQSNYGRGYTDKDYYFWLGLVEPCSCSPFGDMLVSSDDGYDMLKKSGEDCMETITSYLNKVMKKSDESYHFETHTKDKDTVIYSICVKNAKDTVEKRSLVYSFSPGTNTTLYRYPDAEEMINFIWFSSFKPCNKHKRLFGRFEYTIRKPMPKKDCTAFDQKTYLATILPVLKQKGIKSWDFNWTIDESHDDIDYEDYMHYTNYRKADGNYSKATTSSGTMYFIPKDNKDMAEIVFNIVDSLTLTHINTYPEQKYTYNFNTAKILMSKSHETFSNVIEEVRNKKSTFRLNIGKTDDGYYIAVFNTEKGYGYPKEWYILKNYVNGKKEYIKGAKK